MISGDLKAGDTVIVTNALPKLNELQWALLKVLSSSWGLKRIDESEHFTVFQLEDPAAVKTDLSLVLPDRPMSRRAEK